MLPSYDWPVEWRTFLGSMLERSAAKLLQPRINFYTQLKISFELLPWTVERDLRHDIIVICGFTAALVVTLVSQAHFTWCVMK